MQESHFIESTSSNPLMEKELRQETIPKRLAFSLGVNGHDSEMSVEYAIEPERIIGVCGECNRDNKVLFREKVSGEPRILSGSNEYASIAREKIRSLVEKVECAMLCCEDCFTEEFIRRRPEMYLQAMESVSEELGMKIDTAALRAAVLGGAS